MEGDEATSLVRQLSVSARHVITTSGNSIEIRLADTGPGIPKAQQAKLFEAFQGSTKSGSTGLGLAIAAELVRAHGGTISLEKSGQGGSTFLITLSAMPQTA